ncbi:MAG: FAD-dependent oxidoreductase [Puniceicoccales bacterium]
MEASSPFDRVNHVTVYGSGWVGFSAARALASQGLSTVLVGEDGDLLWESSRALEVDAADAGEKLREWLPEGMISVDAPRMEITAADELLNTQAPLGTLLYTPAVAVSVEGSTMQALTVSTKKGLRNIQAHAFVDASERGTLASLCTGANVQPKQPDALMRTAVIYCDSDIELLDAHAAKLVAEDSDLTWESIPGSPNERHLRWKAKGLWHTELEKQLQSLRSGADCPHFVVSHCSLKDYPVYSQSKAPTQEGLPSNLFVLSPALQAEKIETLNERFELGLSALKLVPGEEAQEALSELPECELQPIEELKGYDVVVAGTGTAGAVAAIAAARKGARVLCLDQAAYPGGIGTGGMICGYFYGHPGGIQDELDKTTGLACELFTGHTAKGSWHHDAKKLVLLKQFDQDGVRFLGNTHLCEVCKDDSGRVLALIAMVDGVLTRIPATAFIDSTGDGDLCHHAGTPIKNEGRPGDARKLAYSQSGLYLRSGPRGLLVHGGNFDAGWADFNDPCDATRAKLTGLAQYKCKDWSADHRPITMAAALGIRQTRNVATDYAVTLDDLVAHHSFEDSIGEVRTVADTHSVDFEFESDELAFYYWICRGFKNLQYCQVPYRSLLPEGLTNVWIACRASGISNDASYGLRMQREMQRFGEAAGYAAALCLPLDGESRRVPMDQLQAMLAESGASDPVEDTNPRPDDLLACFEKKLPGVFLWYLYEEQEQYRDALLERLNSSEPTESFYSAAILAMWGDGRAQPRLIRAILDQEKGPDPEEHWVPGAFGQCVDIPFWLQAVMMLRRGGDSECLDALCQLAGQKDMPLNVRTILAGTLERLAERVGPHPTLVSALDALTSSPVDDAVQPPSRSLWHTIYKIPQKKLYNDQGVVTHQDHSWQLHLIIARTRTQLGLPIQPEALAFAQDERGFVREAYAQLASAPKAPAAATV